MRRFFVEPPALSGDEVKLPAALSHRLVHVLRLAPGAQVVLFDGSGTEACVRLEPARGEVTTATVVERFASPPEPAAAVHLYQSITRGERFEWLLEKGTEIGVGRFVPIVAARATVKTGAGNRLDRWRRIVVEAAEQCERGAVPNVAAPTRFADAIVDAPGVLLLPYEETPEGSARISDVLRDASEMDPAAPDVSVFIGPEGGWERAEVDAAIAAGARIVTLGRRVLRSETAGLVAATLVLDAQGELG